MKFIFSIAVLALTGCAATQPRPTAEDDLSRSCFAAIAYNEQFTPLRTKIAINQRIDQLPLEMMADPSKPTAADLPLLSALKTERDRCYSLGESFREKYVPMEHRAIYTNGTSSVNVLLSRLYGGEISYGEFNKRRLAVATNAQTATAQTMQQERDRRTQQESANLADTNNTLQIMNALRPAPPVFSRPTICNSVRVGAGVQTICQ